MVLRKFTGKHLCQSLFFNKVVGLRPATLFKKRLWHRYFPVNFVKFLRIAFFHRTPLVAPSESRKTRNILSEKVYNILQHSLHKRLSFSGKSIWKEMKTPTKKYSEKEVHSNKVLRKLQSKSRSDYCEITAKATSDTASLKINSITSLQFLKLY